MNKYLKIVFFITLWWVPFAALAQDTIPLNTTYSFEVNNVEGYTYSWWYTNEVGDSTKLASTEYKTENYYWDTEGVFQIMAQAKDENNCLSEIISKPFVVFDPDGDDGNDTIPIEPPILIMYAGPDTTIGNCDPYLFVEVFPSADTFIYSWEPEEYLSDPNIANPIFTPGETTTYVLTISTNSGYTGSDTVTITVSDIYAEAGDDIAVAVGEAVSLDGTQSVGNSLQYFWTTNSGTIENGANTPTPTVRGEGIYYLEVTDLYSCTAIDSVMVIEENDPAPFEVYAGPDVIIGNCQPYVFDDVYPNEDSYTYSWQPAAYLNDSEIANPIFTPGETTTYVLTVSTITGVTATDTVTITVSDIYADAGDDILMEAGATAMLDGTGSIGEQLQYLWTTENGNIVSGENTANPIVDVHGKYYVQVTDLYACQSVDSVQVNRVTYAPIANDDYDTTRYETAVIIPILDNDEDPDGDMDSTSLAITQFPSNGSVYINYDDYTLTYTPTDGFFGNDVFEYQICDFENQCDQANVFVMVLEGQLHIPEAFTPNGDNVNDYFEIEGIQQFEGNSLTIINRWGKKVYQAQNYGISTSPVYWDGKWSNNGNNNDVPTGTYYYVLDLGNGEQPIAGSVYIDR